MNALLGVFMVAVDYRVRKRLTQCDFDVNFAPILTSEPPDKAHQLIEEQRDGLDPTRNRLMQLDERTELGIGSLADRPRERARFREKFPK